MRNIRLDSLPSDREIAPQNCQTCTKRRIQCDRSIPSCQKCCSRGLICPGYQFRLRWDQGVASRGKLTGKTVPLRSPSIKIDISAAPEQLKTVQSQDGADNDTRTSKNLQTLSAMSGVIAPYTKQNLDIVDRHLLRATSAMLLHHFNQEVAPRLTWLDGPNNPWRTLVLPLAQRSACLRLSTLGLAAAHLSVTVAAKGARDTANLVQIHYDLRTASLRDLNHKLDSELNRSMMPSDQDSDSTCLPEIISTMISLCYGEMLAPNSTNWKLHLQGLRSGLQRYNPESHHQELIFQFFLEELSYLEAFGSMSSFVSIPERRNIVSTHSTFGDPFREFTELLHEITVAERTRSHTTQNRDWLPDADMSMWQIKFTMASDSACSGIDSGPVQNIATQSGLRAVLRAQYYACLVYSYRALASELEKTAIIPALVDSLYDEIMFITAFPAEAVSHDISFPLFIIGTECRGNIQRQLVIQNLFVETIATTGFSCNTAVLQFLRDFWSVSELGAAGGWIQYARDNEQRMSPFIVF
ncbi:hypothetical protein FSARC_10954 [Fusarium sarcochroum]|uniref:Zn(2)-C6 fungal-type domain-containing protein n=1 Tax=Fusarium sarcochroum TaxID=1208366 RepID=A0A8H4X2I9_9HYPO|nr:hypothetical protein FSARC_10954 [Fusarium sarcochroum]